MEEHRQQNLMIEFNSLATREVQDDNKHACASCNTFNPSVPVRVVNLFLVSLASETETSTIEQLCVRSCSVIVQFYSLFCDVFKRW